MDRAGGFAMHIMEWNQVMMVATVMMVVVMGCGKDGKERAGVRGQEGQRAS